MNYNDLTRRHFEAPACAGVLAGPGIRRGAAGDVHLGTWVQFHIQLEPTTEPPTIRAVRFLAFGCPHVIAAADWVAVSAVGLPLTGSLPESVPALRERFAMPIEKLGRLLMIEDAWIAALTTPYD